MSVPRVAMLGACFLVAAKYGGFGAWGWNARLSMVGFVLLLGVVAAHMLQFIARSRAISFPRELIAFGWLTTLPVAFFEETCFRGLLFLSLKRMAGPRWGAVVSSCLFAIYHWQAQSIAEWPNIFLYGVATCAALYRGGGMVWLVAAHEIIDGAWFCFGTDGGLPRVSPELHLAGFGLLFATAVCAFILLAEIDRKPSA